MEIHDYLNYVDKYRDEVIALFYKPIKYRSQCLQIEKFTPYILEEEKEKLTPILNRLKKEISGKYSDKDRIEKEYRILSKHLLEDILKVTENKELVMLSRKLNQIL